MKAWLISVILLITLSTYSQKKEIPDFGKIDKSDLEMKNCDFDKDAEAYKLLDIGSVNYERGKEFFRLHTVRRIRIKILKEKGIELANVKIRFYSKQNYEDIRELTAYTYNLDDAGNVVSTKLDKASIFTKKIDNRYSEVAFTFPQIKIGSVIEYRYSDYKESFENLRDWYFQDDIPTRFSQYKVLIPSIFRFVTEVFTYQPLEQKSADVDEQLGTADALYRYVSAEKTFTLRNVPALRDEPYMGATEDYLQRIKFNLSSIDFGNGTVQNVRSSWPKLTEELLEDEDFGQQIKKNVPKTKELDKQLENIKDPYRKMVTIYDYVRRNMNSSDIPGIYSMDGIRPAWDKKTGTNTEINMILISLMRSSDLECYPLLVSTREHGSVNTLFPFLQQFDMVMGYVKINGKGYALNAADKYNPARLTPYNVLNTEAYVVDKDHGGWIVLNDNKQRFNNVVSIFAEITPEGILDGQAVVRSADYAKNPRVKTWKENRNKFKDYFATTSSAIKIDSITVENAEDDTLALEQTVQFKSQLNSSGDYKYFNVNMFNGLNKNPFIADERHTDINFGYTQSYGVYGNITIPEGYKIEELPKNIIMITPDTSIILKRIFQMDESGLHVKLTLEFTRPIYAAMEYDNFKEFYKKLYAVLNEQVVIKKSGK